MGDLLDATRGRTTLLVTHRLRGLEEVDAGSSSWRRRAGRGSAAPTRRLLEQGGYYRELWNAENMIRSG